MKVEETGSIPICPECKKPTKRSGGMTSVTCMYYHPVYDEKGNNTNPDRNTVTSNYYCHECGCSYFISGNGTDGFTYGAVAKPEEKEIAQTINLNASDVTISGGIRFAPNEKP